MATPRPSRAAYTRQWRQDNPERFRANQKRARANYYTPTRISWTSMRQRCLDPTRPTWHLYGGRGITIDPRWDSYENFLEDMGERPEGMTLDRIDPDGNYEPGNVRWADRKTQSQNRRPRVKS